MKLYEINEEIERLTDSLRYDDETGELLGDAEDLIAQIESLQMEKRSVVVWLAKTVLNLRADESALKSEEDRLQARRKRLKNKEERLLTVIDRECAGQKTDLEVATMSYRTSPVVEFTDVEAAAGWLTEQGYYNVCRPQPPKIDKNELKALMKCGVEVPGCLLRPHTSCSLK